MHGAPLGYQHVHVLVGVAGLHVGGVRVPNKSSPSTMKVVVQRVTRASVTGTYKYQCIKNFIMNDCKLCTVGDREVSSIGRGLCVLLGITRKDTKKESEWMWVEETSR